MRSIVYLVCSLVLFARVNADEPRAKAWVDSTSYLIGDWITVHVEIKHDPGIQFQLLAGDTLGGFSILDRPALKQNVPTVSAADIVVARYDSGQAILPPFVFGYQTPGDTMFRSVSTNPLVLTVSTVQVDTSAEIKDIKPPLSIPLSLAEIAVYLGILLILFVAAYLFYRYWKKRQQRTPEQPVYVAPAKPAHVLALEELGALKEKKLWQQGLIKLYYSEATEILRRYFENRYHIAALEQTTDEIMQSLGAHLHAKPIMDETESVLRLADLVKFAKLEPVVADHERMLLTAYDIVEQTKSVIRVPEKALHQQDSVNVAG